MTEIPSGDSETGKVSIVEYSAGGRDRPRPHFALNVSGNLAQLHASLVKESSHRDGRAHVNRHKVREVRVTFVPCPCGDGFTIDHGAVEIVPLDNEGAEKEADE
ncbi:hypothetical protein [Streptomyces gilvus]|uniref:hypothetical protein n=1 Tax=Streptomyces gilvus TaxID=2920937 RepID=UPI001F0DC4FF|nr:hypothetical protein [Streptomyces sp. CME 23]MCH5674214.1 hypothetical protein [Streptomyces sp. CME 23]